MSGAREAAGLLRDGFVRHAILEEVGVEHGFGTRDAREPAGLRRPRQVHGNAVVAVANVPSAAGSAPEGDAIVSDRAGVPVGVVTADCVPILLASADGRWVAAVHAGWRGLARGVIAAAGEALECAGVALAHARAVVGPHVRACCYEVDAPVVEALAERFGARLGAALAPAREGHWRLDLEQLARAALEEAGFARERVAALAGACTACDAERFHSHRRDGPRAGRLVHYVAARGGLSGLA